MRRMKVFKQIFLILGITIMLLIMNFGEVKATLQANQNTQYKLVSQSPNWMVNFRNMEKDGEAMGLSEVLNDDLTANESNSIDVHMMRTTEFGAIAILSASGYGNQSNDKIIKSTTGNNTGVILGEGSEWTAGSLGQRFSANVKYYDSYTLDIASTKIGDALGNANTINPGCQGWHSATDTWWFNDNRNVYLRRGGANGIFSYTCWYIDTPAYGRGVAVCGKGL